jgi:hypothetical protein
MKHNDAQVEQITERQMIFNTVYTHLMLQGRSSVSATGHCKYRGPNGTKCAVGFLIPDSKYIEEIEGLAVHNLVDLYPQVFKIADALLPMLSRMQMVHDSASHCDPEQFRAYVTDGFQSIAKYYNLNTDVLKVSR